MRILVGFDGSEGARDAAELADVLRELLAFEVLVVAVGDDGDAGPDFSPARAALGGGDVETLTVAGGSPARVLPELATERGAGLIVVGSPHRGALGRALLGSVATSLLNGSPVPVAVAPRGYRGVPHPRPRTIAVAYDGGEEAKQALAYASTLAGAAGATVRVLSVLAPPAGMPGVGGYAPPSGSDVERLVDEALAALGPGVEKEGRALAGPPVPTLAEACEDGVDLLVAGSRGHGQLGRVLVGSVATGLIGRAPCPVLVVPRGEG